MPDSISLLQFQSPWQGRAGFKRYTLDRSSGQITETGRIKCHKLIRKGAKNLDGIILRPAWPSRHQLCALFHEETLHLYPAIAGQVDMSRPPIDVLDDSFRTEIRERLLYRTFLFADSRHTLVFRDMEGRLLGPQRTAFDIFPMEDFSPFSRLIQILSNPVSRMSLILDMQAHRLDYPKWIGTNAAAQASVKPA